MSMYQAHVTYLDDMVDIPLAESLCPDYSHIESLARHKVAGERDCGSSVIRVNDTWLVSVSDLAARSRVDNRSYILAIQEVSA